MTTGKMGVAISTTGHAHRMTNLTSAIVAWRKALPLGSPVIVTVDGDEFDAGRVLWAMSDSESGGRAGGGVMMVGRYENRPGRQGVAVNKNTGIEHLINSGVEHLFLSDDDTWPLLPQALTKHTNLGQPHSIVCWGASRLGSNHTEDGYSSWTWPRGVMMYAHADVIERVGGMDERFHPGGHEHVEWSTRIYNAGLTPVPFLSPRSYAERGASGHATRAAALWHAEDMKRPRESGDRWLKRKKKNSTLSLLPADWDRAVHLLDQSADSSEFAQFRAHANGRSSATLCSTPRAVEPVTPRSET